jgi:multidrug transporter EmrE-like cation transporter
VTAEYLLLLATVAAGVTGNLCVKLSRGFTRPTPTFLVFAFYALCT